MTFYMFVVAPFKFFTRVFLPENAREKIFTTIGAVADKVGTVLWPFLSELQSLVFM